MNNKLKTHILILAAYLLLTLVFTYPLGFHLNSHIPAYGKGGDAHSFIWNSWNYKKMLEAGVSNPLTTTHLLIPFQPNLTFHTYTLFRNSLVFLLSQVLPFIASFNLVTLFMFIATGFGTYLLTLRFCHNHFAAFISGVIFSFAPFKLARLMTHYNFVDSACLPFFILLLFIALERKKVRYAIGAGFLLAFIGYSSYYYLIFTVVFLALFVLFCMFFNRTQLLRGISESSPKSTNFRSRIASLYHHKFFHNIGVIGLVLVVLFSPILVNIVKHQKEYLEGKKVFAESPDLSQLITPASTSLLNRYLVKADRYSTEKVIFLGFTAILLTLYSFLLIRQKPHLKFWLMIAFVYVTLSLGSDLIIGGKRIIGLPYQLMHSLPILSAARNPTRYISCAMLALGIISACSLDDILKRLKKIKYQKVLLFAVSTLCLIMICGEYLTVPLSMYDLTPHIFYRAIASDKEQYSILELPFSVSSKGKSFGLKERMGLYMYRQTVHNKNLASGWLANLPDKIFHYYGKNEFIQKICFIQEKKGDIPEEEWKTLLAPDPQLRMFFNCFNVRIIFIHRGAIKANEIDNLTRYLSTQLSGFSEYTIRRREGIIRLAIKDNILDPYVGENLLDPEREVLLTEGWSKWTQWHGDPGRWGTENKAVLMFGSPQKTDFSLILDVEVPDFFEKDDQTLKISLNSQEIKRIEFKGRIKNTIELPAELVSKGSNVLTFELKRLSKIQIEPNNHFRIGKTDVFAPVDIHAVSVSHWRPFKGRIMFSGLWLGNPAKHYQIRTGYNIFTIDEVSGQLIAHHVFRTNESEEDAEAMADYLEEISTGRIVIALTWGEFPLLLSDSAAKALMTIGARKDIRDHSSTCHALIGVKGAAPGEAMEKMDPYSASLVLGQFSNAEKVGAWFHRIELANE